MEFDDGEDDEQQANANHDPLTVNLTNLIENNQKQGRKMPESNHNNEQKHITNNTDDRPTLKGNEHKLLNRPGTRDSRRSSMRGSIKPQDIGNKQQPSNNMLFDFFKSLDYRPDTANQGTVRASYKSGASLYNLYGVPGQKPGDKGQVFIQSQEGFDKDLPPVRLSANQRDSLVGDFQEL